MNTKSVMKNNAALAVLRAKQRPASIRTQCDYRRKRINEFVSRMRDQAGFWFQDQSLDLVEMLDGLEAFEGAALRAINNQEEQS